MPHARLRKTHGLLPALLILVVTAAVHLRSLANDFVFDDRLSAKAYVDDADQPQEMIATLQPLSVYFTSHYLRGTGATSSRGYRPLTVLSYALTFHVFCGGQIDADSAFPHRVINVLLQVLNTWLVFLILVRLCGARESGDRWPALFGAMVFGLHPIHTEVIAQIVGRGELFGFCFGASALLLYLRAIERAGAARLWHLAATGLCLGLAFFSKESALAWYAFLPLVRLAVHFTSATGSVADLRRDIAAALLVGLVPVVWFLGMYAYVISGTSEYHTSYLSNPIHTEYAGHATRILTATVVWVYALGKLVWPFSLCCDYGANVFPLVDSVLDRRFLPSFALLLGLIAAGCRVTRRHPLLFVAMACFFGFSFVVSNVPMSQETIFGERTYYTPSLAVSIVVAWVSSRDLGAPVRAAVGTCLVAWLACSGVVDFVRMADWRDNATLFLHDVEVQPRSLRLLETAAHELEGQTRPNPRDANDPYVRMIQRQLAVEPESPMALLVVGRWHFELGELSEAMAYFNRCRNSRLLAKIESAEHESRLAFNVGLVFKARGDRSQARKLFHQAMQRQPSFVNSWLFLLREVIREGDWPRAELLFGEAETRFPDNLSFVLLRGKMLLKRGSFAAAERTLDRAIRGLRWGNYEFDDTLDLVEAVLRQGRKPEAMRLLQDFLEMGGGTAPAGDLPRVDRLRRA